MEQSSITRLEGWPPDAASKHTVCFLLNTSQPSTFTILRTLFIIIYTLLSLLLHRLCVIQVKIKKITALHQSFGTIAILQSHISGSLHSTNIGGGEGVQNVDSGKYWANMTAEPINKYNSLRCQGWLGFPLLSKCTWAINNKEDIKTGSNNRGQQLNTYPTKH